MSDQKMTTSRILLNIAALVVVIAGMASAKEILVPVLLAAFIAIISAQPLFWLRKKGLPNWLSLLVVVLGVFLITVAVGSLVGASIKDFTENLPAYENKLNQQKSLIMEWLPKLGIDATAGIDIIQVINPGAAMKFTGRLLNGIGNALANAFLIIMTVIFILMEAASFPKKLAAISPGNDPEENVTPGRVDEFLATVNQYVAIKTIVSIITGIIITTYLSLLGIDYALLWGLLAFALNYVPNIGSIIAAIPSVMLAIIQFGPVRALVVATGYVAVNVVMGSIVEPRYMGRGLGLSTLVVFLSLLFWGWVLGPVGMLLSVPLTITAKIALDSKEDSRWISILLGPEPRLRKNEDASTEADLDTNENRC